MMMPGFRLKKAAVFALALGLAFGISLSSGYITLAAETQAETAVRETDEKETETAADSRQQGKNEEEDRPDAEEGRYFLEKFLSFLDSADKDGAYALVLPAYQNQEAFDSGFTQMQNLWQGEESYTCSLLDSKTVEDKETGALADAFLYEVKKGERTFQVSLSLETGDSGERGISSFTIQRADPPVGTLGTWRDFSPLHWLVLVLAAAEVIFTIYTAADCMKKKPRLWGLWAFLILMFYGGMQVMITADGTQAGLLLRGFSPVRYLSYPGGEQYLMLSLPLGAAIYWWAVGCRSKRK